MIQHILVFLQSTCYSFQTLMKPEFLGRIFEIYISDFMKIRSMRAELFHADGRTGMTNLVVAFRRFANAPKNGQCLLYFYLPEGKFCF
jgi:hypothetical protein